jgi:hypothetical protein
MLSSPSPHSHSHPHPLRSQQVVSSLRSLSRRFRCFRRCRWCPLCRHETAVRCPDEPDRRNFLRESHDPGGAGCYQLSQSHLNLAIDTAFPGRPARFNAMAIYATLSGHNGRPAWLLRVMFRTGHPRHVRGSWLVGNGRGLRAAVGCGLREVTLAECPLAGIGPVMAGGGW